MLGVPCSHQVTCAGLPEDEAVPLGCGQEVCGAGPGEDGSRRLWGAKGTVRECGQDLGATGGHSRGLELP